MKSALTLCSLALTAAVLALPENRSVISLMGSAGGGKVDIDRNYHASALVFRGEHPLTLRSDGIHALTADATDVRADAELESGVASFGPITVDPGKTLTVTVPEGKTSRLGIVSVAGPYAGGAAYTGGTLLKRGKGRLTLVAAEPYLLENVSLDIAEGTLRTLPRLADPLTGIKDCDVRLNGASLFFGGRGETQWEADPAVPLRILGNVNVSVAEGLTVRCMAPLSGLGRHALVKRGKGCFVLRPAGSGFTVNVDDGACLIDPTDAANYTVSIGENGAVGSFADNGRVCTGALNFAPGASLWYRSDTAVLTADRLTAAGALRVKNLPAEPRDGVVLLKSTVRGLDFELPPAWKGYSVFYKESAGRYEICRSEDGARTLTADGTWTPASENYGTLELNLGGRTLTLAGRTIANRLILTGSGAIRFAKGAFLGANRILVHDSVHLPEAMLFSADGGVTPPIEIDENATVTVALNDSRSYSSRISGPRAADGTVKQGGTLRVEGRGRLSVIGMAGIDYAIDRATLEIDGGQLATLAGSREFWTRSAELRFLSGSGTWCYSSCRVLRAADPLKVYVAKGHSIACDSWQAGGMIKTGEGAYQCCLDAGYRSDIREGYWIPEVGGDNKWNSHTTVRSGAKVLAGRPYGAAGLIVFEKGAVLSLNNGPLHAARIEAAGPILLEGPAKAFEEGAAVLHTTVGGLQFKLPDGCGKELGVFFDGQSYRVRKFETAEVSFGKDAVWGEAKPYSTLTLKPNGHTVTVTGSIRARTLILDGTDSASSRIVLAKGAILAAEKVIVCTSVTVPDSLVLSASETGFTPAIEIAGGKTLTTASDAARYSNSLISGLRLLDGTLLQGGTFLKQGKGELILRGRAPRNTDGVTVAIDGGQLRTVPGNSSLRLRKTTLAFHSGSTVWEYRHGMSDIAYSEDGPLTVWVAKDHSISCDMWQSGGVVKTGEGAYRCCLDYGYTADIREGIWVPEVGNDNKSSSVTVIRSGATVRCGDPSAANGTLRFEDGARLSLAKGPIACNRIEAKAPIRIVDLPAEPKDGTVLLNTTVKDLRFILPEAHAGWKVTCGGNTYRLRKTL